MGLIDKEGLKNRFLEECKRLKCNRWDISAILDEIDDAPTIASPPNDPLTMDELREMEGEPIWIRFIHTRSKSCYRIIRSISNTTIIFQEYSEDLNRYYSLFLGFYGMDWQAYRRKP